MSFDTHAGTRGLPTGTTKFDDWLDRQMARRSVRKLFGLFRFDVAILTTIGHRSGVARKVQVCWFPGEEGSWLIVAANHGTRVNPAWYYNIAAHPDEVSIDIDGRVIPVIAEQLHGPERAAAWQQITAAAHRIVVFQDKTDRKFPILRLTTRPGPSAPSESGKTRLSPGSENRTIPAAGSPRPRQVHGGNLDQAVVGRLRTHGRGR